MVKVGEEAAIPDPSITYEVLITEPSSSVTAVKPLINLEEEPVATDVEEEPKAAANLFVV